MAYQSSPIGVGRGAAQVLNLPRTRPYVDTEGNAQKAANAQKSKDQREAIDKIMDVDFDKGWQEHDNQIQMRVDNYRNKIVGWAKQGGDMTDPDFQRVVKAEQDQIALIARKSEEDKVNYDEQREIIKGDDRFSEQASQNLYNTIFDEKGTAKDAWDIDKQEMMGVRNDSSGYDMLNVYKGVYDDLGRKKESVLRKWNPNADEEMTASYKKTLDGKFFTTDPKNPNKVIIRTDTEEGRALLMEDEFMNNYITQQMEGGKTEEQAFQGFKDYVEGNIGKSTETSKLIKKPKGGLSTKDFDNAMKFKEQVTRIVGGDLEFYKKGGIVKEVNRVRGRDLPSESDSFVQDIDENGMYDVLYKVNSDGDQVMLDVVDFSDMDAAREKIGGKYLNFRQAPTASELEKTPDYIPEGVNEENLDKSEWLRFDPKQFDVSEEEATEVKTKKDDALIEDSHKQLGKGDKGAENLTKALGGRKYQGKTVDRVEKRSIAKSGWQIIYFTNDTKMVIGGDEGNEEVLDEIIRGVEATQPTELTEGGLDEL